MAGHPLRPATRHCLGGPLPRQLADRPRAPLPAPEVSSIRNAPNRAYAVLPGRWAGYPPREGRSLTCYAPVRRSWVTPRPRLACVKHAASVRPEPGSNSPREFESSSNAVFSKRSLKKSRVRNQLIVICSLAAAHDNRSSTRAIARMSHSIVKQQRAPPNVRGNPKSNGRLNVCKGELPLRYAATREIVALPNETPLKHRHRRARRLTHHSSRRG